MIRAVKEILLVNGKKQIAQVVSDLLQNLQLQGFVHKCVSIVNQIKKKKHENRSYISASIVKVKTIHQVHMKSLDFSSTKTMHTTQELDRVSLSSTQVPN